MSCSGQPVKQITPSSAGLKLVPRAALPVAVDRDKSQRKALYLGEATVGRHHHQVMHFIQHAKATFRKRGTPAHPPIDFFPFV